MTATNASGSTPATSAQSAVVQAQAVGPTLGKTAVGALTHALGGNYLEASGRYTLASPQSVTKLSAYVQGGGSATSMRAVIYTDSSNQPSAFVAVSQAVTIASGQAAGWVDFPVSGSPTLPVGQYWLGLWASNTSALGYYDNSSNSGRYAPSTFSAGSNPPASWPGGGSFDDLSYSLYVTLGAPPSAPSNTALPTISGTTTQGQVLTATNGSWNGSPTSFAYQWQRCDSGGANCSSVGSNSQAYVLVAGDVGSTMRVQVTATNVGGSTPATSAQTAVVQGPPSAPVNTVLPAISGTTTAGQQLSTTDGTWTGSPTPAYTYQWRQCDNTGAGCADIPSATNSTYTLVAGDVGKTIRVVVTGTNGSGNSSATSTQTAVVQAAPSAPVNSALPVISGTTTVGEQLSTTDGTWTGSPTPAYTYQWRQCDSGGINCSDILSATNSTYTLVAGDAGFTIRVVVKGTNGSGNSSATSDPTAVVIA